MSSKATGKQDAQSGLTPKLRFPEFRDANGWVQAQIGDIAVSESSTLALNKLSLKTEGYSVYGADSCVGFIDSFAQGEDYIAIVKDGSGVGRLALKRGESSVLGTLAYIKCKQDSRTTLAWLFYCLHSLDFSKYVKGSGIPHIYFSDYATHGVLVPSPAEQQKIADCLTTLDDVIAAQRQKLDALKTHKKGLMQQLFPREGETLPRLRFPEFQAAPEWEASPFDKFVAKSFYGTSSSTSPKGQYPVLRMGNMVDGGLDFSNLVYIDLDRDSFESFRLMNGDILLNRTNSPALVGKVSLFRLESECMTASYIVAYRLNKDRIDPAFCNSMLNTPLYQAQIKSLSKPSVSQANINPTTFRKELIVCVPSPPEQQRIATCLTSLDDLITAQSAKLSALKTHKKGLMQQLFPSPTEVEA